MSDKNSSNTYVLMLLAIIVVCLWSYIGYRVCSPFNKFTTQGTIAVNRNSTTHSDFILTSCLMSPFYQPRINIQKENSNEIYNEPHLPKICDSIEGRYVGLLSSRKRLRYIVELNGISYSFGEEGDEKTECRLVRLIDNDTIMIVYKSDTVVLWKK